MRMCNFVKRLNLTLCSGHAGRGDRALGSPGGAGRSQGRQVGTLFIVEECLVTIKDLG